MKLRITVQGASYEVDVEVLEGEMPAGAPAAARPAAPAPAGTPAAARPAPAAAPPPAPAPQPAPAAPAAPAGGGDSAVKSPIAGNITQVRVKEGEEVQNNQVLMVMEAMKMETNISSPRAGTIASVKVAAGDAVKPGQVLVEFA
jgi:glutaconyl-CoA decarboxylase